MRSRIGLAIMLTHKTLENAMSEPTDPRLGAIRIDFENGTDKRKTRAFILKKLTPKERGDILLEHAKEVMPSDKLSLR